MSALCSRLISSRLIAASVTCSSPLSRGLLQRTELPGAGKEQDAGKRLLLPGGKGENPLWKSGERALEELRAIRGVVVP